MLRLIGVHHLHAQDLSLKEGPEDPFCFCKEEWTWHHDRKVWKLPLNWSRKCSMPSCRFRMKMVKQLKEQLSWKETEILKLWKETKDLSERLTEIFVQLRDWTSQEPENLAEQVWHKVRWKRVETLEPSQTDGGEDGRNSRNACLQENEMSPDVTETSVQLNSKDWASPDQVWQSVEV